MCKTNKNSYVVGHKFQMDGFFPFLGGTEKEKNSSRLVTNLILHGFGER